MLDLGPLAEELGCASLWVMDHLFNTGYIRERLENRPYYHPLSTRSYLAATTSRTLLGTSVMVLPYHNPVDLTKYAATLDQISGGRLTLGRGRRGHGGGVPSLGCANAAKRLSDRREHSHHEGSLDQPAPNLPKPPLEFFRPALFTQAPVKTPYSIMDQWFQPCGCPPGGNRGRQLAPHGAIP